MLQSTRRTEDGAGGPEGDRTPDLYNANVALSQLSHRPTSSTGVCYREEVHLSTMVRPLTPRAEICGDTVGKKVTIDRWLGSKR